MTDWDQMADDVGPKSPSWRHPGRPCEDCGGVGEDANANFYCHACSGTGWLDPIVDLDAGDDAA